MVQSLKMFPKIITHFFAKEATTKMLFLHVISNLLTAQAPQNGAEHHSS